MSTTANEAILRRRAHRHGMRLMKARTRNQDRWDYGTYGLADLATRGLIAGSQNGGFGYSLDEIEHEINARIGS